MKTISKRKENHIIKTFDIISEPINDYHDLERVNTSKSRFRIGFEVEKEDFEYQRLNNVAKLYSIGWCKEIDTSLDSSSGFELVSPIYDIFSDSLKKDLEYKELREMVNADWSDSCGGHITLSQKGISGRNFYNKYIKSYVPLLYALYPNRVNNIYCTAFYNTSGPPEYHSHSQAIEIGSSKVEIRLFPAVRNHKNLLWRLELIRIMLKNPKNSTEDMILSLINKRSCMNKFLNKFYKNNRVEDGYKRLFKRTVRYAYEYEFAKPGSSTLSN